MPKIIKLRRSEAIKSPRFLLCQNDMADQDTDYILHTKHPAMISKVFDLTGYSVAQKGLFLKEVKAYGACEVYGNSFYIIPFSFYSEVKRDFDLAGLLKRTADWYKSMLLYLEQ